MAAGYRYGGRQGERNMKLPVLALMAAVAMTMPGSAAQPGPGSSPELAYRLVEGENLNAFVREGPVAAHLLLRSGRDPRILVAFPAGNSGVGLWFKPVERAATWRLIQSPRPLSTRDMPATSARSSRVHECLGCSCIAVSALANRGSARPPSTPSFTRPLATT
jgi:hypothetical protein